MEDEKCLVELNEILKRLDAEEFRKIPIEIIEAINEKKDKHYKWKYDDSKNLEEQNINRKTIALLSYLNMEYLLDDEKKLLMEKLHKFNERKYEKRKFKKYNGNDIFVNKNNKDIDYKNTSVNINENNVDMSITIRQEIRWYKKIVKIISNIFHKTTNR